MTYRLTLHEETLGVPHLALQAIRDELAERIQHELLVFQVPSVAGAHCDIYGFFLVDKTAGEIVVVGDGFRGDNGGDGGKGHRAAQALLAIYGLRPIEMMLAFRYRDDPSLYREITDKVVEIAEDYRFEIARQKTPQYVDWCFRHRLVL